MVNILIAAAKGGMRLYFFVEKAQIIHAPDKILFLIQERFGNFHPFLQETFLT